MTALNYLGKFMLSIKKAFRRLPKSIRKPLNTLILLPQHMSTLERDLQQLTTSVMQQRYAALMTDQRDAKGIRGHDLKVYSQGGEDGILLYIFSQIGVTNRCFVEFGIGDGRECNTANLSVNFGWQGLLLECNEDLVTAAQIYYREKLRSPDSVKIARCMVTTDNINQTLADNEMVGEIDLLSIDIDGNDYWIWQAITVVQPRVVVIEYNASIGVEASLTVKYDPVFDRFAHHTSGYYHGASLAALAKLARSKGYFLIGCDSDGINAFFVRQDVGREKLYECSVQEAFITNARRSARLSPAKQFDIIKQLEFVEV